jgi:Glutathione S-transferase, N-terminal domain
MFFSLLRRLGVRKDRRCDGVKVGRGLKVVLRCAYAYHRGCDHQHISGGMIMLTFYFAPGSSSMAVHTASHEIGAPFEARPMSFAGRDLEKPQCLAINPGGKVPTLLIDGRRLTEVAAILHYLAKLFPAASLLPENDPEVEAQAISWMSFIAATLHRRAGWTQIMS